MLIVCDFFPDKYLHEPQWRKIFTLPEIIQFAEDFFVFNVAAVVLA